VRGVRVLSGRDGGSAGRWRQEFGQTVRSSMFTPWFAVSIGIVIATSLTLARPHPAVTFPPIKSGRCVQVACPSPSVAPSRPATAIKRGVELPVPSSEVNQRLARIRVEYGLLPSGQDQFTAMILVTGRRALGHWQLSFDLPGATIEHIMWADWERTGPDGVVVRGSPSPWPGSRSNGDNTARIVIMGTGTPGQPTTCSFNGARCTFRALRDAGSSGHRGYHDLVGVSE